MAGNSVWYAGQCVKRHDLNVTVKVIAKRSEEGWSFIENAKNWFPKTGELEIRLASAAERQINDWVMFQVTPKGKDRWKASTYRNLAPYLDLNESKDLATLKMLLTVDGIVTPDHSGFWMIRYCEDRVILLDLMYCSDGRYRISPGDNFCVYRYELESIHVIPNESDRMNFYELKRSIECLEKIDWSPDGDFIKRLIRAMTGAHDTGFELIVKWLKRHADSETGQVSLSPEDRLAALQAARSGDLAKHLIAEKKLFSELFQILMADVRVRTELDKKIQLIAENERHTIRAEINKKFEAENLMLQERKIADINDKLIALEIQLRNELHEKIELEKINSFIAMEEELASRQLVLQKELESQLTNLQNEINNFDRLSISRKNDLESVEKQISDKNKILQNLNVQKMEITLEIKNLQEEALLLNIPKSVRLECALKFNHSQEALTLNKHDLKRKILGCPLLSNTGKQRMQQVIALMLAGETPILYGPQTHDFLAIAETLISSGKSVRLEADPTLINFEDLWLRAGTQLPTQLTYGLELVQIRKNVTTIAVIERADRSAARFWTTTLSDRVRRGGLPRRFLICITVENHESEESKAIRDRLPFIPIQDVISPAASAIAPIFWAGENVTQFDPGDAPSDLSPATPLVTKYCNELSVINSQRLARVATEWLNLNPAEQLDEFPDALIEIYTDNSKHNQMINA